MSTMNFQVCLEHGGQPEMNCFQVALEDPALMHVSPRFLAGNEGLRALYIPLQGVCRGNSFPHPPLRTSQVFAALEISADDAWALFTQLDSELWLQEGLRGM